MDELKQLLAMVGAATYAEGAAAIANFNTFIDAIKALTGKTSTAEAMASVRALASGGAAVERALGKTGDAAFAALTGLQAFAKSVEEATGAHGPEALAVIAAGKSATARVTALEAEASTARKQNEDRDAKEAIAAATAEGRLRPAAKEEADGVYAELGLKALKRFLAALPVGAPMPTITNPENKQPAPKTESAASAAVNAEVQRRLLAQGFKPEEIQAAIALPTVIVRDLGSAAAKED